MPKPPRKRPNMVRCRRYLTPDESKLLRRVLMRESHALGLSWDQVGKMFRVAGTTASQDAAKIHPGDLDAKIIQGVAEMMRAGPNADCQISRAGRLRHDG